MALFDSHRPGLNRLLVLVVLSIVLMSLDRIGTRWVDSVDSDIGGFTDGLVRLVDQPFRLARGLGDWFTERQELLAERRRLEEENLLLRGQMQQYASLSREVDRLRELLNGRPIEVPPVLLARRVGHPPRPDGHLFTIDRGLDDDVRPGDPVIDAHGLVGQVLRSTRLGSTVIEITSRDHMVSVLLGDTGHSALLRGTGESDLVVERVPDRTSIQPGDVLATSGVEGVFPRGYPVARITEITTDAAQGFVRLHAEPLADLSRIDHVLVITAPPDRPGDAGTASPDTAPAPAEGERPDVE
jgi:rod shape-determining protein MreC